MKKTSKGLRIVIYVLALVISTCQAGPVLGQEVPLTFGKPAIFEFARPLCPICKKMEEILLDIKARYRKQLDIRILYINTAEHLFKRFRVSFVPTQVFLDASGKEVFRNEGMFSKDKLLRKLKELKFIQK